MNLVACDLIRLHPLGADLTQSSCPWASNVQYGGECRWGIFGAQLMASTHAKCISTLASLALLVVLCLLGRSRTVGEPFGRVLVVERPCWDDDLAEG